MFRKLLFFTAALGAAAVVPTASYAQSADAKVAKAPVVRATAAKLQSDARRLDHRAGSHERAAVRKADRATESRARAQQLERRALRARGTTRARLEAKADDLRTSAAIADAEAMVERRKGAAIRGEAKKLRAQARRRAKAGATTTRGGTSSLALASTRPCRITIDGAFHGLTPHARIRLAPGAHDVTCEALDGVTLNHRVVTRAGTIRKLHFDTASTRTAALIDPFQ